MAELGSAEFVLRADAAQLIRALDDSQNKVKAATAQIAQSMGVAESSVTKAARQMAAEQDKISKSTASATSGFATLAKGGLAFVSVAAGVAAGAELIHQGMEKVSEETQKANQAQLALNATYRSSASLYADFAAKQAESTKRTVSEVQEAVVAFGSLSNRYAITSEQIKELTKRSADLAAVKGITTVEAAKRLEAALRGEAESAEFLGLTLNSDYLKKFAVMTDEQRKNFETLNPLAKAQITYAETIRQTNQYLGEAEKRTKSAAGAADNLNTATSNLAITFGKGLAPSIASAQNSLAGWLESLDKYIQKSREAAEAQRVVNAGLTHGIVPVEPGQIQVGPDPGAPGSGTPTAGQLAALDAGRERAPGCHRRPEERGPRH
jgi:hypothetical protein